ATSTLPKLKKLQTLNLTYTRCAYSESSLTSALLKAKPKLPALKTVYVAPGQQTLKFTKLHKKWKGLQLTADNYRLV
ncbi:MAG: hypothetical protein LBQ92_03995, partial [Propionibacteriaceae bacterium]|nr:hypothetical protein [Propionibacteriaceae bacterium]